MLIAAFRRYGAGTLLALLALAGCSTSGGDNTGSSSSGDVGNSSSDLGASGLSSGGSGSHSSSSGGSSRASSRTPRCGDGVMDPGEGCDDGNVVTETCPAGTTCTVCAANCQSYSISPNCGNHTVDSGETCDDGNHAVEDCNYGQTSCMVCGPGCTTVPGYTAYCGDRQINGTETCDDGNTTTPTCPYGQTSCTVCTSTCTRVAGATTWCGDGTVNGAETCDDGNAVTEACPYMQPNCMVCGQNCTMVPGSVAGCGDGIINGNETCDDHNTVTESCTYGVAGCTVCNAQCQTAAGAVHRCGDGVQDAQETCDDQNTNADDGCSATCQLEPPWTCTGTPSVCTVGKIQVFNNTSFPIVSLIVDGVEQIPSCPAYLPKPGDPAGTNDATIFVPIGGSHTVAATSGQWQLDLTQQCVAGSQRIVYDVFPAVSVPVPNTTVVTKTYTNLKTLSQMLVPAGTPTCFWVSYQAGARTREARFAFRADGTWSFREFFNTAPIADTRNASSPPATAEVSRLVTHSILFRINTWDAQYDEPTGVLTVTNLSRTLNGSELFDVRLPYIHDNARCP